jgi:hypothetical protein
MLELMKRREIVVEQAEPWVPSSLGPPRRSPTIAPLDESLESFA